MFHVDKDTDMDIVLEVLFMCFAKYLTQNSSSIKFWGLLT